MQKPSETRHVTVEGVSWDMYVRLCDEIVHGATRITFDQGRMEITTVSNLRERVKTILGRVLEAYANDQGIMLEGFGSTTFRRDDLQKGLEPDECYYVANAASIVEIGQLDVAIHPAPDLAIEIDISPPDLDRQPIYAALGVGEIWRFTEKGGIDFLVRSDDKKNVPVKQSPAFPNLPAVLLNDLIEIGLTGGQTAAVAELHRRSKSDHG